MRYYLDTELNGFGEALISLALVAEDDVGRSIFPFSDCPNPKRWVREHVLPALYAGGNPGKVAKEGYAGRPRPSSGTMPIPSSSATGPTTSATSAKR
jgi:hypothetical protein